MPFPLFAIFRSSPPALLALSRSLPFGAGRNSRRLRQGPSRLPSSTRRRSFSRRRAGKKALADLKKLQEQKEGEIRAKAQELKDLQTKISEGRLSLAQDKLADLGKQYEEKEIYAAPFPGLRHPRAQQAAGRIPGPDRPARHAGDQPGRQGDGVHPDLPQVRERPDLRGRGDRHHQRRSSSAWTAPLPRRPPSRASRGVAFRLAELAGLVGGRIEGDPDREVEAIRTLDTAGPRDLSFLDQPQVPGAGAAASGAGGLAGGKEPLRLGLGRDLLVVDDPSFALFPPDRALPPHGGPGEPVVPPHGRAGAGRRGRPFRPRRTLRGDRRGQPDRPGRRGPPSSSSGRAARSAPARSSTRTPCSTTDRVGAGSIVHAGAGSAPTASATPPGRPPHKVPQVGRVGSGGRRDRRQPTIDRGTLGETRIGAGSKIDNLVQVGHNVRGRQALILFRQVRHRRQRPAG